MLAAVLFILSFAGCEKTSEKAAQKNKMDEKLTDIQKTASKVEEVVEGNQNTLNTVTDNKKITLQHILKQIEQITIQAAKGQATYAKEIKDMKTEIANVHNSSILMGYIITGLIIVILFLICILALIVWRLIKIKFQVQRAIVSPTNTLTETEFKNYA
jgi:cobalamin biosynthesis Mg chelatase CobN